MSSAPSRPRSTLAVAAGIMTWMVLAFGTDVLITMIFPGQFSYGEPVESVPILLLLATYSLAYAVVAGYVTGWLAPRKEVQHALALGAVQLMLAGTATYFQFNVAPVWYHALVLTLTIPMHTLGGWLRTHQRRRLLVNTRALKTLL